jgi:nucleoside-diphosphate-sugar epimerase
MSRVLLTGGAGFVGRHFARFFLERGDEVHVVDPIVPGSGGIDPDEGWPLFEPRDFAGFVFERADCRDWFRRAPDACFDLALHLAAVVGGRRVIESNPLAVADDLSIDAAYWAWARRARPTKTVCFSSSAAYPVSLQQESGWVLLREEMIDLGAGANIGMPDLSYGWAKLTCEYLALLAYERHGLASVCYRPFSGYGEDQDDHYPFPSICRRAVEQRRSGRIGVWGSGRQMRDFIHVEDCVRGVVSTMGGVDDAGAINLSTGVLTSFGELAMLSAEVLGYEAEVEAITVEPEGVFARGGDTAKQRRLGFEAGITLRAGVEQMMEHLLAVPATR